jgi:hypothetical protein
MSDSGHGELDRHAQQARERLLATLDVLDHRARNLVHTATATTRATAFGLAGALALSVGLVIAQRASRRFSRNNYSRRSEPSSLIGDVLKIGTVAIMFVGVSAWAKRAAHTNTRGITKPPQLGQSASLDSSQSECAGTAAQQHAGTSHALERPGATSNDPERIDHD